TPTASLGLPAADSASLEATASLPTSNSHGQTREMQSDSTPSRGLDPPSHLAPSASAQAISHRAGPPATAFGIGQFVPSSSLDAAEALSNAASQTSAPVGSGIAGQSNDRSDSLSS